MVGSPLFKGWIVSLCLHTAFVAGAVWVVTERSSPSPEEVLWFDVSLVEDSGPGKVQASAPAEPKTHAESAQEAPSRSEPDVPVTRTVITPRVAAAQRQTSPQGAKIGSSRKSSPETIKGPSPQKGTGEQGVRTELAQGVMNGINSVKPPTRNNPMPMPMPSVVTKEEPSVASVTGGITGVTADRSPLVPAARSLDSALQQVAADRSVQGDNVAPTQAPHEVAAQPARTSPSPLVTAHAGRSATTDFGWLAKTMYRRITELKQYPRAARVHQWEGRVVLRAVIKHDGHLAELSLERSSGYDLLDQEAMDLVRQVCPLPLERTLGRPHVVMYVPITYTLEN